MSGIVFFNGRFVDESEVRIPIDDGGWLHGAGVFETMRAEHGRVFRLESHLQRLCQSSEKLLAPLPPETLPSRSVFSELLARNELAAARVRLTVSAGPMRVAAGEEPKPTVCATASELSAYPPQLYESGIQVLICPYRLSPSDPLAGMKTVGYLPRLLGLREAQQARCMEALWFTTANRLAEGCISNVFVVRNGVLHTPPLDTPVLPGIARGVVMEVAGEHGIDVHESPLTIDDLLDADEVFLTSVIMQVLPVIRVERHDVGEGRVGPMARRLLDAFCLRVRKECETETGQSRRQNCT